MNVFVLISGWFGINCSKKGFFSFIFQCGYFYITLYLLFLILGDTTLNIKNLLIVLSLGGEKEWFIKAYIGLYILSPVLNTFAANTRQRDFLYVVVSLFLFETIVGFSGLSPTLGKGYSVFSFIVLYLLARYIRLHGREKTLYKYGGWMFLVSCLVNIMLFISKYYTGISLGVMAYDNPFNITGAMGLVLFFNNIQISHSKVINYISASCFGAYLLHYNSFFMSNVYAPMMRFLYEVHDGILCLSSMLIAVILVFIISVIYDQPRKWIWKKINTLI